MVDVLEDIKEFLIFESEDDFYFLQIRKRAKDSGGVGKNQCIKSYYIKSIEHLEEIYEEIKSICILFNARAMLSINKKSFKKVALLFNERISVLISNEAYSSFQSTYDSVCAKFYIKKGRKWILDIDEEVSNEDMSSILFIINDAIPEGNKLLKRLPTKNGMHLLVKPFYSKLFEIYYPKIQIHKNHDINLFIP